MTCCIQWDLKYEEVPWFSIDGQFHREGKSYDRIVHSFMIV